MFSSKETQELTNQVRELVEVNKALLNKLEAQGKMLGAIADFVGRNSSNAPSFGVTH